jgi:hypothetical protein
LLEDYFFLLGPVRVEVFLGLADGLLDINFDRDFLILAALFLWMTPFLAALSVREIALIIFWVPFSLLATRNADSKEDFMLIFTNVFFLEPLRARLAVFVTGMAKQSFLKR